MDSNIKPLLYFPFLFLCMFALAKADDPVVEFDEFNARMALELGQLVKGEFRTGGTFAEPIRNLGLNRNIVFLEQSGSLGDSWAFAAGLMGVLWWPYTNTAGPPGTRTMRVEPKLAILSATKNFGASSDTRSLQFGYFPYKYNRDARNLGEYLYRSGTYPGNLVTSDGYQLMDHPAYDAYGAHFRMANFAGKLVHDFNLFTEPVTDPVGDITPAYEVALNLPIAQIGFGAAWNRGLAYHPSLARPKDDANSYIEVQADAASGRAYYKGPFLGAPVSIQGDTMRPYQVLHRWTHRGIKLMGRAALDLGFLLPETVRGPEDLRVFSEIAVLGWENQPYYYETRSDRMPIMFGINLPAFNTLDLLSLQAEYYASPFNDTYFFNLGSLPIWKVENYATRDTDKFKISPWRWSLYGRKSVNRILDVHAQIACDHLRLRETTTSPTEYELMLYPKNWYFLVRMEIGI